MATAFAALYIVKKKRRQKQLIRRILRDYQNPFLLDEDVFKNKFNFDQNTVQYIHDLLAPIMKRHMGYPVTLQILVSLQILRSGCFQHKVGSHGLDEMFHMSQASLSRSFDSFLDAILDVSPTFVEFPSMSEFTLSEPKMYGQSKISGIMGVVHCFPVYLSKSKAPVTDVHTTKRDKCYLNVQVVCDSNLRILDAVSHWPGDAPKCEVWKDCDLRSILKENPIPSRCFLVGDRSFPLEPWLLVQYQECEKTEEFIFNDHINKALSIGKLCYGAIQTRFKCLHCKSRPLYYSPEKSSKIVVACLVLHNIGLKLNQELNEVIDLNEECYTSSNVTDIDTLDEDSLLKNEGMAIRDEIAKTLLCT